MWHRTRIESIKAGRADVYYIDFGNVSGAVALVLSHVRAFDVAARECTNERARAAAAGLRVADAAVPSVQARLRAAAQR